MTISAIDLRGSRDIWGSLHRIACLLRGSGRVGVIGGMRDVGRMGLVVWSRRYLGYAWLIIEDRGGTEALWDFSRDRWGWLKALRLRAGRSLCSDVHGILRQLWID